MVLSQARRLRGLRKDLPPATRNDRIKHGVLTCPNFRCAVDPERQKRTCYMLRDQFLSLLRTATAYLEALAR